MQYECVDVFQDTLPSPPGTPTHEPLDPETFRQAVMEVIINRDQYNS